MWFRGLPVNRTSPVPKTISFLLAENNTSPLEPVMLNDGVLNFTVLFSAKLQKKKNYEEGKTIGKSWWRAGGGLT